VYEDVYWILVATGFDSVTNACEHNNESWGSLKDGNFTDYVLVSKKVLYPMEIV
jgi:hypothetical protein